MRTSIEVISSITRFPPDGGRGGSRRPQLIHDTKVRGVALAAPRVGKAQNRLYIIESMVDSDPRHREARATRRDKLLL